MFIKKEKQPAIWVYENAFDCGDFIEKIEKDDMIEYSIHNNWYYGLSKVEYENKDLFILSPLSFNNL